MARWPEGMDRIAPNGAVTTLQSGPLLRSSILQFMEDRDGGLWLGTGSEGVFLWESPPVIPFDEPEGLDRQVVWSVLEDRAGSLWMGTRKGLRRLDPSGRPASVPPALSSPAPPPSSRPQMATSGSALPPASPSSHRAACRNGSLSPGPLPVP